ncbi:MAG TPA: ABC transporter substrate-binding protein, partial [Rikenellaceae bacterium]|nr:ABC transporter substrate-binding protein [Rikenellaceae bacterium]
PQNQALKKVNFLPLWVPQPQFAGYYMAKDKKIYEKYGLDVNIISGGFSKDVPAYLKEGKAHFGIMYLSSALRERAKGTELVNVGQIFQRSEIMFVTKKSSGIKTIHDFRGKKIAVWRTVLVELTSGFLKKHNISAEVININEGVNIFLKDAVDICAVMYYNEYNSLINFGIDSNELNVFYFRDFGMDFPEDGIYCMEQTYKDDPDLCEKFVKASLEGWSYALLHPDETLKVLRAYQKIGTFRDNLSHSKWMLNSMKDLIQPLGKNVISGELLESDYINTAKFLRKNKFIDTIPEFNDFFRGTIKYE